MLYRGWVLSAIKRAFLCLALILSARSAFATASQVQSTNSSEAGAWGNGGTGITTTPNFGSTVTLNNYILVQGRACITNSCSTTTPSGSLTVSDTLGLRWIACGATTAVMRQSYLAIWIAKITSTGAEAITVTCTGCGSTYYGGAYAREMSGTGLTSVAALCDVTAETEGSTLSGGTASISSPTTNFSSELVVADIYTAGGGCSTAPAGWTGFSPIPGAFNTSGASGTIQTAAFTGCVNNGNNVEGIIATFHDGTPACTGASPNWTVANWALVQSCHDNLAVNGDTITVLAGSYSVTTPTTISKGIKLIAGAGGVTLTDNTCAGFCPSPQGSNSMVIMVENSADSIYFGNATGGGFTINNGTASHNNPGGVLYVVPNAANNGKPVVIQGNTMNDTTHIQNWINYQPNQGLVTGNTFTSLPTGTNCITQAQFVQSQPEQNQTAWATTVSYGAADSSGNKNLYIEGNTVRGGITDLLSNGRVVFRYNNLTNASPASIHGITDVNGRYIDIDHNTWIRDQSYQAGCSPANTLPENINGFIRIGGGVALIHHNTIPNASDNNNGNGGSVWGSKNTVSFTIDMLRNYKGGWPCWNTATGIGDGHPAPEQPGWGFTGSGTITVDPGGSGIGPQQQGLEPIYFWANNGTGGNPVLVDYPLGLSDSCDTLGFTGPFPTVASYMTEATEYYLDADAPTGKSGYGPYTCPHPLANLAGACDPVVNGTGGYNIGTTVLRFTVQPATTTTGSTMASFQVTDSDITFSGTVTLTKTCAASFTNLTATASAGVANFASVHATGTAIGCVFTAAAAGASNATSLNFNINPAPGTAHRAIRLLK